MRSRRYDGRDGAWDLLCLSPHYDDAALSCGGLLHRRAREGRRVLVLTVFGGPPRRTPLSAFAAAHHRRWGAAPGEESRAAREMVELRAREERRALEILGVDGLALSFPDAIYRADPAGGWLYPDLESLFGPTDPREHRQVEHIAGEILALPRLTADTELLAPLALGGHVDHRLVREVAGAVRGRDWMAFEDFPYAARSDGVGRILDDPGWSAEYFALTREDVDTKIRAVAAYASQISTFWEDTDSMATEVLAYSAHVADAIAERRASTNDGAVRVRYAERIWRPS